MLPLEITQWENIKQQVHDCNPSLAEVMSQLDGIDDTPFVIARYRFGDTIEEKGQAFLPTDQGCVNVYHDAIPKAIRQLLDYSWNSYPIAMTMKHCTEMFCELPDQIIPLRLTTPGTVFSLFNLLEHSNSSNLIYKAYSSTAGARTLLTLPKLTHSQSIQRLEEAFALAHQKPPKGLTQQWDLFNSISHSEYFQSDWRAELLLFSKAVVDKIERNLAVRRYLLKNAWDHSAFTRNQHIFELVWATFLNTLSSGIRHDTQVIATAKHLIMLAVGEAPGYVPATHDDVAPTQALINVMLKTYRIRYYFPVFMQLQTYDGKQPLYYSLQSPIYASPLPKKTAASRTINELKKVKATLDAFITYINSDHCPIVLDGSRLRNRLNHTCFDFLHPQAVKEFGHTPRDFMEADSRFTAFMNQTTLKNPLSLPECSVFFNGCIRIQPLKQRPQKPMMQAFLKPLRGSRLDGD